MNDVDVMDNMKINDKKTETLEKEAIAFFDKRWEWNDFCHDFGKCYNIANSFESREKYHKSRAMKKLREEVWPIKIFLQSRKDKYPVDWIEFHLNKKNDCDATLQTKHQTYFIEVTYPKDGHQEYYQAKQMDKHGYATSGSPEKLKKEIENNQKPQARFVSKDDRTYEDFKKTVGAIEKKLSKPYPDNTMLLVALNFPWLCCDADWKELHGDISNFQKDEKFLEIYLVNMMKSEALSLWG